MRVEERRKERKGEGTVCERMCEGKWELGGREEEICGEGSKGLNF